MEAGVDNRAPVQKHLIQNHVQEDADIAEEVGARVAHELVFRSPLRRREVTEDENRLEDVVDESEAEEEAAARVAEFRIGEEFQETEGEGQSNPHVHDEICDGEEYAAERKPAPLVLLLPEPLEPLMKVPTLQDRPDRRQDEHRQIEKQKLGLCEHVAR